MSRYIHDTHELDTIFGTYRLQIIQDEDPESPREWENLGTMICWHRRYNLGDPDESKNYSDSQDLMAHLADEDYDDLYNRYYDRCPKDWSWEQKSDAAHEKARERINKKVLKDYVILPLYLYDHSGISMNTSGFSCGWDSGQVGFIYCERSRFIKETGYTKKELFSTDKHRTCVKGEHVRIRGHKDKGHEGWGKVISKRNGKVTVDFWDAYSKQYRETHGLDTNLYTFPIAEVEEVRANMAEEMLKGEVETYDQYLRGDVYGFKLYAPADQAALADADLTEDDIDDDNIDDYCEEIDSCWGFYGNDWKTNGMADHVAIDSIVKRRIKKHTEQVKTWIRNKVPHIHRKPLTEILHHVNA
jgi:hypothetical protein